MRLRAALIGIVVILLIALVVLGVVLGLNGSGPLAGLLGGDQEPDIVPVTETDTTTDSDATDSTGDEATDGDDASDDGAVDDSGEEAPPTATESEQTRFVEVVVARVPIPVGTQLRAELLTTELRPATNVAVRAGYVFNTVESLEGAIIGTAVSRGQEILDAMLALNPTDLSSFGSDLSLYVEQGQVAVAFPINEFSGASFAMRPGDRVDVLMTMLLVEVDPEFQSVLPNIVQEVDETALLNGEDFLFPPVPAGRLELIPFINQVAFVGPRVPVSIPRPVTQLTVQQAEVLWVGTWPGDTEDAQLISPSQVRLEDRPDIVILGLSTQDALVLKWALEAGINIDLVLRAQGDTSLFVTTSVSLPQMVEQSGITIPEGGEFRLEPPIYEVDEPSVPDIPPSADPRDTPETDGGADGEAGDGEDGEDGENNNIGDDPDNPPGEDPPEG